MAPVTLERTADAAFVLPGFSFYGRLDTHPFFILACSYSVCAACLILVPPKTIQRFVALCILGFFEALIIQHADVSLVSTEFRFFFGHVMVGIFLYASYFLCLIKCTPSPELAVKSLWHKAKWAIGVVSNPRGIGTEWQIRNLPRFSRKDKGYIPSRRAFLIQRIAGFVCFYILSWVYPQLSALLALRVEDFEFSKLRLFSLSTGELLVRVYYAVDAFLLLYIGHNTLHWLVSAIAVLLGDSPERWPPLFGDIRDAYTLRRFWGKFWHGLVYKAFVSNAAFISRKVLRIPERTKLDRWAITFFAFCLSAFVHVVGDRVAGSPCSSAPICMLYIRFGLAIVFEDAVQALYLRYFPQSDGKTKGNQGWKVVGYVWTLAFFSWSISNMFFAYANCNSEDS